MQDREKYNVGQVLFLSIDEKSVVVPIVVSEKIVRETIEGSQVSYLVDIPGKSESYRLSKINGQLFTSLKAARNYLTSRYNEMIDEIIADAKGIAADSFGYQEDDGLFKIVNRTESVADFIAPVEEKSQKKPKSKKEKKPDVKTDDNQKITLPDGTVANLKL